jgi:molecular chaperone Hsp33
LTNDGAGAARGDHLLPFMLEQPQLRGRLLRADATIDSILGRHAYPAPVALLLGELLVLTGLLSSLLKFDGSFTVQTRSVGPVRLMVADMTSAGALRGYASFDASAIERLKAATDLDAESHGKALPAMALLGEGLLAFTVDLGEDRPSHQGIVELAGDSLSDCLNHYFRQSEQLPTASQIAVSQGRDGGRWHAAGLLLQELPENLGPSGAPGRVLGDDEEDSWRRALMLMATCSDAELLDPALAPNDLLFRLFHEEQVRVFPPRPVAFGCRCSRERIETTLRALPAEEIEAMRAEGHALVTCEFCNTVYRFDAAQLDAVMA